MTQDPPIVPRTDTTDTIVAVSSPPGASARAIVRLSGPDALSCADALFLPSPPIQNPKSKTQNQDARPDWTAVPGLLTLPAFVAPVPCLLLVMRGPRSYTREDVVEFHVPGSPPVAAAALDAVLARGARLARPGEFTERAYLSGRIDLAQAEAVMKLIHSASDAEGRLAMGELDGALSKRVGTIAERLTDALTQVELALDFSEEDIPLASAEDLLRAVEDAARDVDDLRRSAPANYAFSERARVSIIGRANAGKSSLFNRLLVRDAAIVTPVAGTTRDTLEEEVDIGGVRLLLVDTAGERAERSKVEGRRSKEEADPDEEAIRRAREERERADLLLLVIDGSAPLTPVDLALSESVSSNLKSKIQNPKSQSSPAALIVLNKTDLPACPETSAAVRSRALAVPVSCATGEGLDRLRDEIRETLSRRGVERGGQRFLLNLRQVDSLRGASEALSLAQTALADSLGLELAAADLRAAIDRLRCLTRPLDPDELLDRIFSRFCIGK